MSCEPDRLIALLAGELSEDERAACDGHLLECEDCWAAVLADRAGQAAACTLRVEPPDGLAERITAAIGSAATPRGKAVHRMRMRLVAATSAIAMAAGATGWLVGAERRPADPPAVAAVTAVAPRVAADAAAASSVVHLAAGGQQISVRFAQADGIEVAIATSRDLFAAPAGAQQLSTGGMAWVAQRGPVALYCLNAERPSVLLAGSVPVGQMPALARDLGLAN